MKAKLLLRLSVIPIIIKFLGHSVGHSGWDKPEDEKMKEVVASMKNHTTEFMGASYNMAEYYTGYSLMILVIYAVAVYVIWILSIATVNDALLKRIVWAIAVLFLFFGALEFIYFFPFAAIMSVVASVLMIAAVAIAQQKSRN